MEEDERKVGIRGRNVRKKWNNKKNRWGDGRKGIGYTPNKSKKK